MIIAYYSTVIPRLPIVLLLGVAVLKESAVNDLLPDACLNCIRIEYFQLSDSTITFGNLVNEVCSYVEFLERSVCINFKT